MVPRTNLNVVEGDAPLVLMGGATSLESAMAQLELQATSAETGEWPAHSEETCEAARAARERRHRRRMILFAPR